MVSRNRKEDRVGEQEIKDADSGRPASPAEQPGADDARGDREKLKRNRERLHVNDEHKTPAMEKGHRGTFP